MDGYQVTAEFYDLLQGGDCAELAQRLLDRWLGEPQVGVLDVGAGTGIPTAMLAERSDVTVHAVEPTASMRSIMLSRLAALPHISSRIRIHAVAVQELALTQEADVALCLNMMSSLDTAARACALAAIARAVVPGGTLIIQRPPAKATQTRGVLPTRCLGGDRYTGQVIAMPAGSDRVEWQFTYQVSRNGALIRAESEIFSGYAVSARDFNAELALAGFTVVNTDKPNIVIARR